MKGGQCIGIIGNYIESWWVQVLGLNLARPHIIRLWSQWRKSECREPFCASASSAWLDKARPYFVQDSNLYHVPVAYGARTGEALNSLNISMQQAKKIQ